MNRLQIVVFIAFLGFLAPSHAEEKPAKGFLSVLKEGQIVLVKENAGRYEITIMKDMGIGHKIIEVGSEFIVVEDAAGVTSSRIPVYSIKAIITFKFPKE